MAAIHYILPLAVFTIIEYVAILISSSQLKSIIHDYMQEADIVYQRPAHPLKYFLATQKALFFLVCFFTICISIYLKSHFHFNPEYVLGAVVLFKILSLVMQTKKRQLQGYEDRNLAMAFQDDFQAFVNSWKTNMIIEIVTLSAGVIILSLDMLKV